MRAINYRELKQLYRTMGPRETGKHITESLGKGDLVPNDVDFCELAEAFFGWEFRRACDPARPGVGGPRKILEAVDAVDSTAFLDITQRVISKQLMDAFTLEANMASSLVDFEGNVRLRNERRPGITPIGDEAEVVHEGMPIPNQDFSQKYQDFGDNYKRGMIVGLTKEALFFTGQSAEMLRQANCAGNIHTA